MSRNRHVVVGSLMVTAFGVLASCKARPAAHIAAATPADLHFDDQANPFPNYSIYDHGRECFAAMDNTPFPEINCLEGALVPVTTNGVEQRDQIPATCDKPDLVDEAVGCVPGARIRKVVRGDILSIYMCRRILREPVWSVDSAYTHNIAAFQFNTRTSNVCWFQIRKHESGIDGTHLPPPFEQGRVKGDARDLAARALYIEPGRLIRGDACIRCHDSQLFVRTPFLSQLKYSRRAADRENAVPDTTEYERPLHHIGKAFASWNLPENQPFRIRIDLAAYNTLFPPSPAEAQAIDSSELEPADACTQCHAIGKSGMEHRDPDGHRGTCGQMITPWLTAGVTTPVLQRWLSDTGKRHENFFWMPPGVAATLPNEAAWRARYRRATEALARCCANPTMEIAGKRVCAE